MLSVRLKPEIESKLRLLAKKTDKSMSFYVNKALEGTLEDLEDIYLAIKVLEANKPSDYLDEDQVWSALDV